MSSQTIFVTKGSTNYTCYIDVLQDNSGTNPGDPLTGLVYNSTSLVCYYVRPLAAAVQLTLATQTVTGAHSDGGFVEISSANAPGKYRLDLSDAVVASGVDVVSIELSGFADLAPHTIHVVLTSMNMFDSVRAGLTALPNAAADAAGGLIISDAGGLDADAITSEIAKIPKSDAAVSWNATALGAINAEADTALSDYAPNTVVPDAAGVAPTAVEIRTEIDSNSTQLAAIVLDTGTTLENHLTDIKGGTFSGATDSLEAIRDRGDASWTTGAGGSDRLVMVDTTIATLATQTSFTLTAGSTDDDAYNNLSIVIEDVATSTQKAVGMVLDYVGSTKTVTLKEALAFNISTTDKVYILAENSLKSTVANRQLDVTAAGNSGIDWGNVENPTTAVDLSSTDIQLADSITNYTGNTPQTADHTAQLAAIVLDTGTSLPAQIDNISSAGGVQNKAAASVVVTTGTPTGNITDTKTENGAYWQVADDAGTTLVDIDFDLGANGSSSGVSASAYLDGVGDSISMQVLNWPSTYDTIGTVTGKGPATNDQFSFELTGANVGTGANIGIVRIRFTGTGLSSSTLFIDKILTQFNTQLNSEGYQDGSIWIDTVGGTDGTTEDYHGIVKRPVDTIDDVVTLQSNVGLSGVRVINGSAITAATAFVNKTFKGVNWTLAGAGQDFSGSDISGATLSGIFLSTTAETDYVDCEVGDATVDATHFKDCEFNGTLTLGGVPSDVKITHGGSIVAGANTPILDFGTSGGIGHNVSISGWGNGIEFRNYNNSGTDLLSLEGNGQVIFAASCSGSVELRGNWRVTNTGGVTLVYDDNSQNIIDILDDTSTSGVALAATASSAQLVDDFWDEDISRSEHNTANSGAKKIRQLAGGLIRVETAQGSGVGNNQIQLDTGASAVDGAYDPSMICIVDGTGVGQSRLILQYSGATKTATVDRDWKVNPDATSEFSIACNPGREHVNEGLAQGGTSTTITLNALASSGNDVYAGQMVFIRSGTGQDEAALITSYNGTSKVATIDGNWVSTPDTTSAYIINPTSPVALSIATQASIDAIEIDTNELQSDWADGGRLDLLLDAIKLITDALPESGSLTTIDANIDTVLSRVTGNVALEATLTAIKGAGWTTETLTTIEAAINGQTDPSAALATIQAVTDLIPDAGAMTSIAKAIALAVVDSNVDAIKAVTDVIPDSGALTTIQSDLDDIQTRVPTTAELVYMVDHAKTAKPVTFTSGTTTTAVIATVDGVAPSSTDDRYNGRVLIFNFGTLDEEATDITDYDGGSGTATFTATSLSVSATHTAILV